MSTTLEARREQVREHEESRRLLKVGSQLISLTEAHQERICPGFQSEGCIAGELGDELDPGQELCAADQKAEEDHYKQKAWEKQCAEDEQERSPYYYLHAERRDSER